MLPAGMPSLALISAYGTGGYPWSQAALDLGTPEP